MAQETVTRNLRDSTVFIKDAGANSVELACDTGDLKSNQPKNVKEIGDRGDLSHRRQGDAEYVPLSMSTKFKRFLAHGAYDPSLWEVFNFAGKAAAWVSTNDDGGDVKTLDVQVIIPAPNGTDPAEILNYYKCDVRDFTFSEGDDNNSLEYTGKAEAFTPEASSTT